VPPTAGATAFTTRISRISISATMAVSIEAATLRSEGADLVEFGAGEPHFTTPEHIKRAAIEAIQQNFTKYTPVAGIKELREAVTARHKHLLGLNRSRRRSHHPHALLGFIQGYSRILRRQMRLCGDPRRGRLPPHGGHDRKGHHAPHPHYSAQYAA